MSARLVIVSALLAAAMVSTSVSLAADGAALYSHYCAACHDRGPSHPGTARLADRWPQQASLLDRQGLPAALVRAVVRQGFGLMPPFRPTELSDAELDTLAAYLAAGPHPAPTRVPAP